MSKPPNNIARLMKRCQIGVGGRNAIDDAHDIMAECYGTLGKLSADLAQMTRERDSLRAEVERLQKAEADFHMAYRLKCDEETKALHVEVERLRAALGCYIGDGPDGYAVVQQSGYFAGIWRDRESAELVASKQPARDGERVVPMMFLRQKPTP